MVALNPVFGEIEISEIPQGIEVFLSSGDNLLCLVSSITDLMIFPPTRRIKSLEKDD